MVRVWADEWRGVDAALAETFWDRLIGIRSSASDGALLIETKLLHTLGLDRPLHMVGLDDRMRVIDARTVVPNRFVHFRGAKYVLELVNGPVPIVGSELVMADV